MNACQYVHTDLGEGEIPFNETVEALKAMHFDGYLSLEWESPRRPEIRNLYGDPDELLKKYNRILDEFGG